MYVLVRQMVPVSLHAVPPSPAWQNSYSSFAVSQVAWQPTLV